jgi:CheY-like chemotaxis protein
MTTGKRALIVDDSRSARIILSRMLEQNGLTVDTAESAEQALDYLQRSRPDVIFMDHLMPGMDGFQAVQVIKSDPLTATIPLMMYTSQEGELYVSQARALGAVGVLPKTVRPVDVSRVLYQLHLLPDRRTRRTALFSGPAAAAAEAAEVAPDEAAMAAALAAGTDNGFQPEPARDSSASGTQLPLSPLAPSPAANMAPPNGAQSVMTMSAAAVSELQAGLRQSTQQLVKDQLAEQRRFMLATFEAFARRLTTEVRESIAKIPVPEEMPPPPPSRQWWPVMLTALLAAIPAAVLGYLAWQANVTNQALNRDLAESRTLTEKARADALAAVASATMAGSLPITPQVEAAGGSGGPAAGPLATEYVQYGDTPFAGVRLDRLRAIAATLEAQDFQGKIRIVSFVGDFCLSGNATDGFAVADAGLAAQKCDLVGNPFDDSLSQAQRQSVDFANFAGMLRKRTGGRIEVEIVNGGRQQPVAYPVQEDRTSAGDWNVVAAQNNRVEFHILPT